MRVLCGFAILAMASAIAVSGCESRSSSISSTANTAPSASTAPMNNDAIGDAAQSSMQQKFDTDAHFKPYHLQVTHITVVNAQANSYKGVANVRTQDGVDHQVGIDVTYDGQTVLWQSPPGAFLFLADEKPKP